MSSNRKMLVFGAGAAWSRLFLPGARVGSETSDFRSRSRPIKWRLRNTADYGTGYKKSNVDCLIFIICLFSQIFG